jgi:HTH-type transcriptional regulator/antitoxin HigA
MTIKPIKTEKDYQKALKRLETIFDAKPHTKDGNELDILGFLIEKYEEEHYHIDVKATKIDSSLNMTVWDYSPQDSF